MHSSTSTAVARSSLAYKLGVALAAAAGVVILLSALAIANLRLVHRDARKFMEETREARLADNLLTNIEQIQVPTPERPRAQQRQASRFERSRELMGRLHKGPATETDPSEVGHQETEVSILDRMQAALDRLEVISDDPGLEREADHLLTEVSGLAEAIRDETDREAAEATQDLESRVVALVWVAALSAAAFLALFVILLVYLNRSVVRPIKSLREGAMRFGRGDLEHRIEFVSDDEIGDLASEFNSMANRLDRSHRDLEDQVEQRTRQFVRAARLADLGTFAAGIAHEVNTPLASIASCAEGLERRLAAGETDRAEQSEYLQTIAREAFRAHEITDSLLAFARDEPGPVGPVEVEESILEVSRLLDHRIRTRGIDARYELGSGLPPVAANGSELKQVMLNLVSNALDATPDGSTIFVRCRSRGSEVVVEIEDQGPGVPESEMKQIFDPFFTTKDPGKGTGLGLALAARIVEGYGGSIDVANVESGGARFSVALPISTGIGIPAGREVG